MLCNIANTRRASCTASELRAATKYLTCTLSEYCYRKKMKIGDARYDPEDEAKWREDRALKGDWQSVTGFPDGSEGQEVLKQIIGEQSIEVINRAREIREKVKQSSGWDSCNIGGTRYELANAIRHAWLICHDGHERISYGRQTDKHGNHCGPLHEFIKSLTALIGISVNTDELHKNVLCIDKKMHPLNNV